MEHLSDGEKQKRFIDERDRIRDQRGRRRRAPFHLVGLSGLVIGIIFSAIGIYFTIQNAFPIKIIPVPTALGIGLFLLGVVILVCTDKFGRRRF